MSASTHRLTAILDLRDRLTNRLSRAISQTEHWRDANGRLRDQMGRFVAENRRAHSQYQNFTSSAIAGSDNLSSKIMGIVGAIGAVIGVTKTLESTLGAAMDYEMSQAQITAMYQGNAKAAKEYMDMVQQRAQGSPLFNESEYLANSKSFIGLSKDTKELEGMWSVAERLAAMDPAQGLEGAVMAMRELAGGDAVSLVERFELPRKEMNKIKAMKLPEQIEAMNKYLSEMGFGEDFLDQISDTGLALKNQIVEKFQAGLRDIGLKGLEKLKPQMAEFLEMINSPAFDKFKEKAGNAFASVLGAVTNLAMMIVKNWGKIQPVLEAIGVGLATAFAVGKIVAIQGFIAAAGGLGAALATLFSPIVLIAGAVALLYLAFKNNFLGIRDAVQPVIDAVIKGFNWLKEGFNALMEMMTGSGDMSWFVDNFGLENAVKINNVLWDIVDTFKTVFSFLSGVFNQAKGIFTAFWQFITGDTIGAIETLTPLFNGNLVVAIIEAFRTIKSITQTAWDYVVQIFQAVAPVIMQIVNAVWPVIQQIIQSVMQNIVPFLQSAWAIITGIFNTVMPIIIGIVQIAWNFIKQIIDFVMPYVLTLITTVWNTVISVFMTVWNYIASIMPMIQAIITTVWTILQPIVTGAVQIIWEAIKVAFDFIWNIVSWTMNNIGNIIQTAWIFISGLFKAALQLLTGDFSGAWETLKQTVVDGVGKIGETLSEWVGGALQIGKDFVQGVIDGFLGMWDALVDTAKGLWDSITGIFSKKKTVDVNVNASGSGVDGSHANGLTRVPFDGYMAELHKNEAVLTAQEADLFRKYGLAQPQEQTQRAINVNVPVAQDRPQSIIEKFKEKVINNNVTEKFKEVNNFREKFSEINTIKEKASEVIKNITDNVTNNSVINNVLNKEKIFEKYSETKETIQAPYREDSTVNVNYDEDYSRQVPTVSEKHSDSDKKEFSFNIAKLADSIIVREESDIDKIADALARKLMEAGGLMA